MKSKLFPLFIILASLACQIPSLAAPTAAPPTPTPRSTLTATPTQTAAPTETATPAPHATRVLILSIDGLRPDAIALAPMPNLSALMQNSAYTLNAQTVYPSLTLVAHSSMLTGLCPSKHGVDWNEYFPDNGYARGTDLFDIAHAAGLQTVMYVGKDKMRQITEPSSTDIFVFLDEHDLIITEQLIADFPQDFDLLFVHFPSTDWLGHDYSWLSEKQLEYIRYADEALGKILAELDARDIRDETLIIITADHGGHETSHNSNIPEDMTIPWIVSGPGVQPKQLTTQVYTTDTAATAAFMLGLPIPPEWDGVPVYEAFGLPVIQQSLACEPQELP
jgi:predicted AlkP superfamily pyrophosphatase or phosphodiesterase